ncbi:MAG: phosphopyruvate hydratase [bacterium]
MSIKNICAREILSSGSTPSIEVKCVLESGVIGIASVPYGASAGIHEAYVLLDNDFTRYMGKGMLRAVENVNAIISKRLIGMDAFDQRHIDETMISLDGTENKSNLGANAILGVSMAVARAAANEKEIPLYQYIRKTYDLPIERYILPNPMFVVIEGGKHADNSTDLQEYLLSVIGDVSVKENVRCGIEIYLTLKTVLKERGYNVNVGNEGAFAPSGISDNELPLQIILEAIKKSGYEAGKDVGISIDAAASEFYKDGKYHLKIEEKEFDSAQLIEYYLQWFKKYPIITTEDMLDQDDWKAWIILTEQSLVPNIGDDLTVTNVKRLQKALDGKAINAILIKLNQIGTLTETVDCCMLARENGLMTVISHRGGGETNDTSMIDLAVAVNAGFVKVGPSRGERVEKYNRLMEIEDELGDMANVAGHNFREIV